MHEQETKQAANTTSGPALSIIFEGLFFFCFNTNHGQNPAKDDPAEECQVGFVTTAPGHTIMIQGTQKIPLDDGEIEMTTFSMELTHAQARDIQCIDLDVPGAKPSQVTRRGHPIAIDRRDSTPENEHYFKWIIDLEKEGEMHETKLNLIPDVLKPVMHINIGEFYTNTLSSVRYTRIQGNTKRKSFGKVAATTGMRVDTLPQDRALLKIGDTVLPLVTKKGATCELCIMNHRPAAKKYATALAEMHLSDFPFYYHAFDVTVLDRFDFDFVSESEQATSFPPALCYSSSGSKTWKLD